MKPEVREILLHLLDEGYDRAAWHGPTLCGSIRGVSAKEAARRPGARRHSIWELAIHAAYWKYAVRRRLTAEKRGFFPRKGSNWLPVPNPATSAAWKRDVELLAACHRSLREAVAGLRGLTPRRRRLIAGIAMHHVYHAGQIQLVKRMIRAHP
ncbi:MAG TPA: DinB family protein [Planctomycetota bacterium]|nr:DinB family protein [Planctomycetota bacterium]